MQAVAKNNYGSVSVVMHPECSAGYDDQRGIAISMCPEC